MENKHIIPATLPEGSELSSAEREEFAKKRKSLISELRCISGLPEVASNLNQETLYQLVLTPEGAKLYKDAQGNLKGVFYKNGKIAEHAKLKAVGPSAIKAIKTVGAQVLLVSIAMQLNRIEEQISKVFLEFHGDRLAEIQAGKSLFNQACGMRDLEKREQLILHAITELTRGFEKTVSALTRQIADLPEEESSFLDNWINNKSRTSVEKNKVALESFSACLNALQTIARCHLFLEEREVAFSLVEDGLAKIEKAGVSMAYIRSRLSPKINQQFPEVSWKQFIDYRKSADSNYFSSLISPHEDAVEIEIKPLEISEIDYARV